MLIKLCVLWFSSNYFTLLFPASLPPNSLHGTSSHFIQDPQASSNDPLTLHTDESYSLVITTTEQGHPVATITSATFYGGIVLNLWQVSLFLPCLGLLAYSTVSWGYVFNRSAWIRNIVPTHHHGHGFTLTYPWS